MEEKPEYETSARVERPGFLRVLDAKTGRLLFLFDPERDVIEIKPKGAAPVLVDLRYYRWMSSAMAGVFRLLAEEE